MGGWRGRKRKDEEWGKGEGERVGRREGTELGEGESREKRRVGGGGKWRGAGGRKVRSDLDIKEKIRGTHSITEHKLTAAATVATPLLSPLPSPSFFHSMCCSTFKMALAVLNLGCALALSPADTPLGSHTVLFLSGSRFPEMLKG